MKIKTRADQKTAGSKRQWALGYLDVVKKEAKKFLNDVQYEHVLRMFDSLAIEDDPAHSKLNDVKQIEDYYELRAKHGVLGKINVRVYFAIIRGKRLILALAVCKKEADGQTPTHIKIKVRSRLRTARKLMED